MWDLASALFSKSKVKVIPLVERQDLPTVWKSGVDGKACKGIESSNFHKVRPEEGSGLSRTRFAVSSQVDPEQIRDDTAACRATREEYFVLWLYDKMVWSGGTSHILVPSGKTLEFDPYHSPSFFWIAAAAYVLVPVSSGAFLFLSFI
jgi:hypothetical protein